MMQSKAPKVTLTPGCFLTGNIINAKGSDRGVHAFLGVSFAQPPIGSYRFKPPQPLRPWFGTKPATEPGKICPQAGIFLESVFRNRGHVPKQSEDCLYLNIWAPANRGPHQLPVIVYLHGGGFTRGIGSQFEGTTIAAYHDVIFISINYRLGIFGFLCTGDDAVSGNMGLLDQLEALRWVNKYISQFGGDPNNVTLMGNSAGGMCIGHHLVSPLSKGLFHRAVCQSGTATYPTSTWTQAGAKKFLLKRLKTHGCVATEGTAILKYLNSKSSQELLDMFEHPFPRVIDNHCITGTTTDMFATGKDHKVPVLLGFNTNEGCYLFAERLLKVPTSSSKAEVKDHFKSYVGQIYYRGHPRRSDITKKALELYLGDVDDNSLDVTKGLSDFYGDLLFIAPTFSAAKLHVQSGKDGVYVYHFAHRPSTSAHPDWVEADHADECAYLMGRGLIPNQSHTRWTSQEENFSRDLMKYITNFATSGNPNKGAHVPVQWPQFDEKRQSYLQLKPEFVPGHTYRQKYMDFWNETVPSMADNDQSVKAKL